jgi:TetR/AcrR family transcriptional regulator, regulator of cefoperazone and chloramphenicol sensitivity
VERKNRQRGGYRKGDETRERILDAALTAFGKSPFSAVTTRQIADAAHASLPTLQYYFGGKEGLYRACAQTILERFRLRMAGPAADSTLALSADCNAEMARHHLRTVVEALSKFLIGSKETERWAQFVARELREPGPAFDVLYANLWRPGVEIVARLIARILRKTEIDATARVEALLLISSLLAFQSGRGVSMRIMGWKTIGSNELSLIQSHVDVHIDALGRDCPRTS